MKGIKVSRILLITTVIFSLSSITSKAQIIEEFPKDSTEFIETYTDYMEGKVSESNEGLYEQFIEYWGTGKFSEERRDSIIYIADQLLKNNGKREPHFITMMDFFIMLDTTGFQQSDFNTWMKSFRYAISRPRQTLPTVMRLFRFTHQLLKNNSLFLSNTRTWYVLNDEYRFVFDSTLKIVFQNTDLKCHFREDSILIYNTAGTFYPFNNQWQGKNGRVTWERAGYSKDSVYAELSNYQINMTRADYKADSVLFVNKLYFDKPVLGRLEDQLVHIINPPDAIYPVFNSYKNIFEIKDIYENMDFTGGFTMKGSQFIGSGGTQLDAVIHVRSDDKRFMTIESQVFILKKKTAVSRNASVIIHLEGDSIFHTGLQFNYYVNSQEIEFTTNDNVLSESVYYNSYHNISMKFDRLLWKTTEDKIYFTYGRNKAIGNAAFTSENYFTLNKWNQLEMRDDRHPLIAIRNYGQHVESRKFDVIEYSKYVRKPTYQVKHRLMNLAKDGFIFYDMDTDTVTINDKLYDFINSRIEKIDYDVIRLESTTQAPKHNGILDLTNMDLQINGVPNIHLSDSQDVRIFPSGRSIIMQKNRHFRFGGVVDAGLFTFFGKNYNFNYDEFKITLDSIDSLQMKFQTEEMNMYGQAVLANVENTINNLSGDIFIDKPDNKSGKESYPTYPKFESKQKSFVYYDNLFNGPYKRENFYFELYPFQMDSLDNFNPENLRFTGNFYSANIFPPFEETLELRPDNSLGFVKQTPGEGYPLYEGKGKYFNTIDMSNKGLKGKGELTYLTSEMETDDILFFPDSTAIHANTFKINQKTTGIEYPHVASQEVNIKWYPHDDIMNIDQTSNRFRMFNEDIHLNGDLTLKPTGLTGKGELDMSKAIINSDYFSYESRSFDADTSDFALLTMDTSEVAFTADQLNAHIDLDYQRGRFNTINKYTKADFPKNFYVSYLNKFAWKMDENSLDIRSFPQKETTIDTEENLRRLLDFEVPGALYVSTHKAQDSLRFISSEAQFTLEDLTLQAEKVDSFYIADAKIIPKDGMLKVREMASMDTLRDAEVIANRKSRFHRFFESKIKVKGRNDYVASADYHYVDKNNKKQVVHFDRIQVDTSIQTTAKGQIAHIDSFTLSPNFRYRGNVFVEAPRRFMEFKGGVRLYHDCPTIKPRYTYFESVINPNDIYIPIGENIRDLNRKKVFAGAYITIDSTHVYSTFLTPRKDPSDNLIISSRGFLKADDNTNKYIIAPKHKLLNPDTTGSLISLHKKYCQYHGEGKIYTGADFGEMKINPAGRFDHDLIRNEAKLEVTMPVDFLFSPAAMDTLINDIRSRNNLKPIDLTSKNFRQNLNEIYGTETTNDYLSQVQLFKEEAKIPEELSNTILFSDIDFRWNTATNSYVAQDDIGIAMINGKPVHKYVNGYVEIIKQRGGDRIYIYLKLDDERFYFFYYFRTILRTWSNNKTFTDAIKDLPDRKRRISDGLFKPTKYRYILSTESSFARFLTRKKEVEKSLLEQEEQQKKQKEGEAKPSEQPETKDASGENKEEKQQKEK